MNVLRLSALIAFGIPLSVYDIRWRRLPNILTSSYAITGFIFATDHRQGAFMMGTCAVLFGGASVAGLGLGLGDSKLIVGIAAWSADWPDLLCSLDWGFGVAGLVALVGLSSRRLTLRQSLPFGPFLLAGAMVAFIT